MLPEVEARRDHRLPAAWRACSRCAATASTMDLILTGRALDAEEALRHGIVSRVVPARRARGRPRARWRRRSRKSPAFTVKMARRNMGLIADDLVLALDRRGGHHPDAGLRLAGLRRDEGRARREARAEVPATLSVSSAGSAQCARSTPARRSCSARVDDGVGVVTLNDPDNRNPLGSDLRPALRHAIDAVARDPEIRCLLLTGAGNAFCAGGNAKAMATRRAASARGAHPRDPVGERGRRGDPRDAQALDRRAAGRRGGRRLLARARLRSADRRAERLPADGLRAPRAARRLRRQLAAHAARRSGAGARALLRLAAGRLRTKCERWAS